MKNVYIKSIEMQDFKGIKNRKVVFSNNRNIISGANGIGKTTIAEAITFTIFGKGLVEDKINNEPIDKTGNIKKDYIQKLTLVLDVDGVEHTLEKELRDKYYLKMKIDGKPIEKVKDWNSMVEDILSVNQEEFTRLTNPKYMNALSNKEARNYIIGLLESENEIKYSNSYFDMNKVDPEFKLTIKHNLDAGIDIFTQLKLKREDILKNTNAIKDIDVKVESKKETLSKITTVEFVGDVSHLIERKEALEKELSEIAKYNDEIVSKEVEKKNLEIRIEALVKSIKNESMQRAHCLEDNVIAEEEISKLRDDFDATNNKPIEEFAKNCSLCGQKIDGDLNAAKEHALSEYEKQALKLKGRLEENNQYIKESETNIKKYEQEIASSQAKISAISFDVEKKSSESIQKEYNDIVKAIGSQEAIQVIKKEITTLESERVNLVNTGNNLKDQEMVLTGIFTLKTDVITNTINKDLENIEVKLFKIAKNGNIKEIFTIISDGIDFDRFNNAKQINAGIELLNFMQSQKQVSLPIIVDNVESVNKLQKTNSQTIELKVSETQELEIKNG